MSRTGRPPVGPRIDVHLPRELLERVEREAERLGVSRSTYVRDAVAERLDDGDK